MLSLGGAPGYRGHGGRTRALPQTLPGWLLVFLAIEDRWIEREALAPRFWPDLSVPEGLHNLRVNVHRLKQLLGELGCAPDALQTERTRLRLVVPHEVSALSEAIERHDVESLLLHRPRRWLVDGGPPSPGFGRWSAQLRATW